LCQMRARSGKFRDSPITILAIAGTRPPSIIAAARDSRHSAGRREANEFHRHVEPHGL
jgi:hypothetical protein